MKIDSYRVESSPFDRRRRLTDTQIRQIRREYAKGVSVSTLARKLNVHYNTVRAKVDPEFHAKRKLSVKNTKSVYIPGAQKRTREWKSAVKRIKGED